MAILDIITYPDPILKNPTKPVTEIDDEIRQIVADMADTMYAAPGVGLAAIQAGIDKSIIVYDPEADDQKRDFRVLINPEITFSEGSMTSENEGCLSVPDFRADVKRHTRVTAEGLDLDGNPVKIDGEGLLSIILQHEIDHLNGVLFIDRISALKRQMYKKKRIKALKSEKTL
jgi:peptide deformylase